ncbi:MAG: 50S ribosomal protein L21 [Victivallales bacterium]|nr:50S ribosomal protein L21 [Victivallales bacterium]
MNAVIATGGKQYRVDEQTEIDVERLPGEVGSEVVFNEVLTVGVGADIECGAPFLASATVKGEIIEHFRGKKLTAFKMKRRKGYRKKHGHRQELTKIKISIIEKK